MSKPLIQKEIPMVRLLIVLVLCLSPVLSQADSDGPCGADGPKHCKEAAFGKGSMFECLVKNKSKVSQVCREHLNRLTSYRLDCTQEIKTLCSGKPFFCLLRTEATESVWEQASKTCLTSVILNAEYMTDCKTEIRTECSQSSAELPKLVACLKQVQDPSAVCKKALERK